MAAQNSETNPRTGAQAVIADAMQAQAAIADAMQAQAAVAEHIDPSRRPDVLFRVRRDEDHVVSVWWPIGAFVGVTVSVILLLSFIPGGV